MNEEKEGSGTGWKLPQRAVSMALRKSCPTPNGAPVQGLTEEEPCIKAIQLSLGVPCSGIDEELTSLLRVLELEALN